MSANPPEMVVTTYAKVLWEDQKEMVIATVGRTPRQLRKYATEGLSTYTRGKGTGKRYFWITDEVIAFLKATSRNSNDDSVDDDGD